MHMKSIVQAQLRQNLTPKLTHLLDAKWKENPYVQYIRVYNEKLQQQKNVFILYL